MNVAYEVIAWLNFAILVGALIWLVAAVAVKAIERVLCVATLIEAAKEARRQGRAPILRLWLRSDTRGE